MVKKDYPEVYSDDIDEEYVNDLIVYINKKRNQWLKEEFRLLIESLSEEGIVKSDLEIYLRLINNSIYGDKTTVFPSLNAIEKYLHKNHISKEHKKLKPFKWVKSTDRKDFFGKEGMFEKFQKAGFLEKEDNSKSKKQKHKSQYVLKLPKFKFGLRYKLKNEDPNNTKDPEQDAFSGIESTWNADDLIIALDTYLYQGEAVWFDSFRNSILNENIDLISYLECLLKRLEEPSLDFLYRLTSKYAESKKEFNIENHKQIDSAELHKNIKSGNI